MAKNAVAKEFKGCVIYSVKGELDLTKLLENNIVLSNTYEMAGPNDLSTIGFKPIVNSDYLLDDQTEANRYVISVAGADVILIGQSKKKIPAQEVQRKVESRIKELRDEAINKGEEFKVNKELKDMLKETVITNLLPHCFVDEFQTYAFHDKQEGLLYVMVPSFKKAEEITALLRCLLGSVPTYPLTVEGDVSKILSSFITGNLNNKLTLGDFVELEGSEGKISWKNESLYDADVEDILEKTDKEVVKIELEHDGKVSFVITNDLVISGLKFDPSVTADSGGDFVSTFILMLNDIRSLTKELVTELGGKEKDTDED